MRPPLGGAGHVVPSPKGSGTMGIIMPLYTVGIVVFFVYTIMKVSSKNYFAHNLLTPTPLHQMLFKKQDDRNKSADFGMDPEIKRMMFGAAAMEECAVNAHHTAQCTEPIAKKRSPEPTPAPAPAEPVTASATTNGSATSNGIRASSPPKAANKLGKREVVQKCVYFF
jgi:Resistance to inhibitors of cholinesterase homologue 3